MKKINGPSRKKDEVKVKIPEPIGNISFCFEHSTENRNHSFSYFGNDMRNRCEAYESLYQKMTDLGQIDTTTAKLRGKISGSEPIPYKSLSKAMQMICDKTEIVGRDSYLSVFRFGQNKYRLLCKPDMNHPNLLHVIAFDFDYSAYDHG